MKNILWVLCLIIQSCGEMSDWVKTTYPDPETKRPQVNIDPKLEEYLDLFKEDADYFNVVLLDEDRLLRIEFGDPAALTQDPMVVGICSEFEASSQDSAGFTKKTDYWKTVTVIKPKEFNIFFKLLMYHELGHCLLNRPHSEIEEDLMYPSLNSKQALDPNTTIEKFFKENSNE